jgi:DNA polymerase-1
MSACTRCDLFKTRGKNYVKGIGLFPADVAIIGLAPSAHDAFTGYPFSGSDKKILDTLLENIGLNRKKVFTTNLLQCQLRCEETSLGNKKVIPPTQEQLEACWFNLDHELSFVKPKVIILLGAEVARMFLGGARTISSIAGKVYDSIDCRGLSFALDAPKDKKVNKPGVFKVVPTYSLVNILREPARQDDINRAFLLAKNVIENKSSGAVTYNYHYAYTEKEVYEVLNEVLARAQTMHTTDPDGALVFDIETSGFNWYKRMFGTGHVAKTISCAFSFKEFEAYAISLQDRCRSQRNLELFRTILEHPVRKCGHNGKFDNVFLRGELGIKVANYSFDTMIAAYHLNQEADIGLDKLAPIYRPDLGYYWETIEKQWLNRKANGKDKDPNIGYLNAPLDLLLTYNCKDVDVTQTLYKVYREELKKWGAIKPFMEISMPHSRVLEDMEFYGVKMDVSLCIEKGKKIARDIKQKEVEALATIGRHPHWWGKNCVNHGVSHSDYRPFNISSSKQISDLLFKELKLPIVEKTEKGAPSVNEATLKFLKDKHPFIPALMEYRKLQKFLSTYLGWEVNDDGTEGPMTHGGSLLALVGEDGRLRPSYNITGTATGRLSCAHPNLQNQPKTPEFRNLFVAEPGWKLADADFSALELRIVAILANDEAMIDIFRKGIDPHSATAAKMFGIPIEKVEKDSKQRKAAKAINFGIIYGQGAPALAASLNVDESEAKKWLEDWAKTYQGITKFVSAKKAEAKKFGYVSYGMNRRRPLPSIWSNDKGLQAAAERASVNTPVQGCLKYSTRVTTDTGMHQIGDLYTGKAKASRVWDGRGWRQFIVVNRGPAELVEVETLDGTRFDCDVRHEFLCHTMRGGVKFRNVMGLIPRQTRICARHNVALEFGTPAFTEWTHYGKAPNSKKIVVMATDLQELWFAIGYHIGDGCYRRNNVVFCFGEKDLTTNLPRLSRFFESIGAGKLHVRKTKGSRGKSWQGTVNCAGVSELFSALGYARGTAKTKRIPTTLWSAPLEHRKAFIEGYYASDGIKTEPFGSVHCSNPELLREYRLILHSIGVSSKMVVSQNGTARVIAHDVATNHARGSSSGERFYGLHPDYDFRIIKSVRPLGIMEDTYTLSVFHDDHCYDSEGLISKNTAADCTSTAAIRVWRRLLDELGPDNARMVLEIHDQIVVEFKEGFEEKVKTIMLEEMRRQMPFLPPTLQLDVDFKVKNRLGDED